MHFDNHRIVEYGKLSLHNAIIKCPLILYRIDLSIKFLDLIIQFGIYTSEIYQISIPITVLKPKFLEQLNESGRF